MFRQISQKCCNALYIHAYIDTHMYSPCALELFHKSVWATEGEA